MRVRLQLWVSSLALLGCSQAPSEEDLQEPRPASSLDDLAALGYATAASEGLDSSLLGDPRAGDELLLTTDGKSSCVWFDRAGQEIGRLEVPDRTRVELAVPTRDGGLLTVSTDEGLDLFSGDGVQQLRVDLSVHHEAVRFGDHWLVADHVERQWRGRRVRFDRIVEVDREGAITVRFDTYEARDLLIERFGSSPLDLAAEAPSTEARIFDRFHLNSLQVLEPSSLRGKPPAGGSAHRPTVLVCLRNASAVFALDLETREIAWTWNGPALDYPHTPRTLRDGSCAVFDNRFHGDRSRVVILEPGPSPKAVFLDGQERAFFSRTRGSLEELPSGNLLVTVSDQGRVLELTRTGEVVFDWESPLRSHGERSALYRVTAWTHPNRPFAR